MEPSVKQNTFFLQKGMVEFFFLTERNGFSFKYLVHSEMIGWQRQLNGHESKQTPKDSEGKGSLVCYSPWGRKKSDRT